jgi:hypothetical protein
MKTFEGVAFRGLAIQLKGQLLRSRNLVVGGVVVLAIGTFLGWPWLTAIGIAPIFLAVAPCLVMCSLGFCAHGMTGKGSPCDHASANASGSLASNNPGFPVLHTVTAVAHDAEPKSGAAAR